MLRPRPKYECLGLAYPQVIQWFYVSAVHLMLSTVYTHYVANTLYMPVALHCCMALVSKLSPKHWVINTPEDVLSCAS